MAITNFIPELWAARLLAHLDKAHVATAFVNRDYEGEIRRMGDTVHVNSVGDITISDYTANSDMDAPEALSTTKQDLVINNAKYFNFQVDDIDRVQAAGDIMDAATQRAAYGIADVVDAAIFAHIAGSVHADNTIGSSASPTDCSGTGAAYNQLVALRTLMVKNNVPSTAWRLAAPPEFIAYLLKDDRFVKGGTEGSELRLVNGYVGRAAGFDIFESNNLPTTSSGTGTSAVSGKVVLAAPAFATSFAEQIVEVEAYRPEARFADALKGLNVYGVKTFYDKGVAKLIFS